MRTHILKLKVSLFALMVLTAFSVLLAPARAQMDQQNLSGEEGIDGAELPRAIILTEPKEPL